MELDPPGTEDLKSARFIERYARTWADFLLLRPKRFTRRLKRSSHLYLSPGIFATVSLALSGLTIAAFMAGDHRESDPTAEQMIATFAVAMAASNLILVPIGACAARILRRRYSLRRAFTGYCYATCASHVFPVLAIAWAAGQGTNADPEKLPAVVLMLYLVFTTTFNVTSIARFNRQPAIRFTIISVAIVAGGQLAIGWSSSVGQNYLPSWLSVSEQAREWQIRRARSLLNTVEKDGLATFNTSLQDAPTLRVASQTRHPNSNKHWRAELLDVRDGEALAFDVYYHNTSWVLDRTARNVRARLTYYGMGETLFAIACLAADNVAPVYGIATVRLADGWRWHSLTPTGGAWYPDQSGEARPLPDGQQFSSIQGDWLRLGDVRPSWSNQGHVVVTFRVNASREVPTR